MSYTGRMRQKYSIGLFVSRDGIIPVQEYMFDEKNLTDLSVLINVIQRLAYIGQAILDTDMAKHIDGPIFELRKDRHRILYCQDGQRFVLLSAFLKRTQKTPQSEIDTAYKHYEDYTQTKGCLELTLLPPA